MFSSNQEFKISGDFTLLKQALKFALENLIGQVYIMTIED